MSNWLNSAFSKYVKSYSQSFGPGYKNSIQHSILTQSPKREWERENRKHIYDIWYIPIQEAVFHHPLVELNQSPTSENQIHGYAVEQ